MDSATHHRPRNVDWKRAAALLYGDWGTSKAYVIGFAFSGGVAAAGYRSLPIIVALCVLTGLVAYCYMIVCKHFPDGGGVYSAARDRSRFLAVMGALLLVADFTVTAAMSGWSAMSYFRVPEQFVGMATIGLVVIIGAANFYGPRHSGSLSLALAVPMVLVVMAIIVLSLPHLSTVNLKPLDPHIGPNWLAFTGMILTLSGVEAIANLTGVMKLDPGSTMAEPRVSRTSVLAIVVVSIEVVLGTALLGWAMLSLPSELETVLQDRWQDMLSVLAEQYGKAPFGPLGARGAHLFGVTTGIIVGLLLLSAVNTAVAALIGLIYMLARDGEMPRAFTRLNSFGVPWWPLGIATLLPIIVVSYTSNLESLMGLYAIGVVGAITVNLWSCTFNPHLGLAWHERWTLGLTSLLLFGVELTVARTKPDALFFAVCVVGIGFGLRSYAQRRAGLRTLTVSEEVAAHVSPESVPDFQLELQPGQGIMVAARGVTPVLKFALEEARLRQANLYVLYVKEVAVQLPGPVQDPAPARWQDDSAAAKIMYAMLELGKQHSITVVPVYAVSDNAASTIVDLAATLGVDFLLLGVPQRQLMVNLLRGNVVHDVASQLPDNIQLIIHG
jgi:nucleotide-binding universal stress UspA family protein